MHFGQQAFIFKPKISLCLCPLPLSLLLPLLLPLPLLSTTNEKEFRNYVHEGDLVIRQYLSGEKPVTVTLFVPTDEAFANIDLCSSNKIRMKPRSGKKLAS